MRFEKLFKKKVSSAVIIHDKKRFVAVLPTFFHKRVYNLPKGIVDKGETEEEAAIREIQEETGIELDIEKLKRIGRFPYKKHKDIMLFSYKMKRLPNIRDLRCTSTFEHKVKYGLTNCCKIRVPEIDSYKYIQLNEWEIRRKMTVEMVEILIEAFNEIVK